MKKSNILRIVIVLVFIAVFIVFFAFDLQRYLTLDFIKEQRQMLTQFYHRHLAAAIAIYALLYVAITATSLPGAAVMTLIGGALFGITAGVIIVSFASTIGATLAFMASRFLLRDFVQKKFGDRLAVINEGVQKEGEFYLFTLRLVPLFPFFLINLAMGLTPIRTLKFYLVSQIGMLPGTIVYIFAGTQLAQIDSLRGILSPKLILAFALLGIFPLVAKKGVAMANSRRALGKYRAPKNYDYNVAVIGAGSAGLVASYISATVKAKVALIEKHKMGGDCLNTGCVPSKALIRSAKMLSYARRAKEFGFEKGSFEFDFSGVMERVRSVIKRVEPHDSEERYSGLGVDVFLGEAKIEDPYRITVDGKTIVTRNIILATGANPFVPPIPGVDKIEYLTSDTLWDIRELPKRLIVLGGGPIGCEMAQTFARFGAEVSQVEMAPQILIREDQEVVDIVTERFKEEGVNVLTGHKAKEFIVEGEEKFLICEFEGKDKKIPFDEVIIAVGRKANVKGFGLEELGVEIAKNGAVAVDPYLQTNFPNIYVCGDAAGPYQFTHTASHQAWYAAVNALFRPFKKFQADYTVIPWCTFTDPEVARVGLNEKDAKTNDIPYELSVFEFAESDRAIADSETHGFVRVLTVPGKDRILGVTIVGVHAGDLISEFVSAMKHRLGLNKILQTIHIYPTLVEVNKSAAGVWRKAHIPEKALGFLEKYFAWKRK